MEKTFTIELTNSQGYFLKTFMGHLSNSMYAEIINKHMAGDAVLLQLSGSNNTYDMGHDKDVTYSIWQKLEKLEFKNPEKLIIKYQYAYINSKYDTNWKITTPLSNNEFSAVSSVSPSYTYIKILETMIMEYE